MIFFFFFFSHTCKITDLHPKLNTHVNNIFFFFFTVFLFRIENNFGDKIVIMYSGNHAYVHPLDTILHVALKLQDNSNFLFVFVGGGVRKKDVTEFKNKQLTIVVGSSWAKDEKILADYINSTTHPVKFIIAPHNIKTEQIQELRKSIGKQTVLFSEKEGKNLSEYEVLIIDTIGILTKIYSEADIAYVGGGFGNPGVHNLLEPATFGVPIVLGPNYSHFAEATALVNLGGCEVISNENELKETFDNLIQNTDVRQEKGHICSTFVKMNTGALYKILQYISNQS
jgi:hypothetical protein